HVAIRGSRLNATTRGKRLSCNPLVSDLFPRIASDWCHYRRMLRTCWILISLLFAADLQGAIISGFAAGFANQTPGFWGIEFQSGAPGERIASVALKMPGPGFFDFDGVDNYQNQTAPIFDAGSSFGLSAGQVFFSFTGEHPKVENQIRSGRVCARGPAAVCCRY